MDKKIYTDDLINEGQEPIIIRQESGGDKKFIYTLLILLIILFIIALGIIAFLGAKFFSAKEEKTPVATTKVVQQVSEEPVGAQNKTTQQAVPQELKPQEKKRIAQVIEEQKTQKKEAAPKVAPKKEAKAATNDELSELEAILAQEEAPKAKEEPKQVKQAAAPKEAKAQNNVQQAIATTAAVTGTKKLTPEEMAQIAKLVAQELAKMQQQQPKNQTQAKSSTKASSDSELVASLQKAQADTLEEQNIDVNKISQGNVKAKGNAKNVDTFNKVIVERRKGNEEDEFAKLTQEIDAILQTEEVKQKEESLAYKKELEQEAKRRAQELRFIVVKPGDTLSSIAYRAYGRASAYTKIYKANPDLIKNPNKIYVGMRLRVPVDEEYVGR